MNQWVARPGFMGLGWEKPIEMIWITYPCGPPPTGTGAGARCIVGRAGCADPSITHRYLVCGTSAGWWGRSLSSVRSWSATDCPRGTTKPEKVASDCLWSCTKHQCSTPDLLTVCVLRPCLQSSWDLERS